MSKEVITIKQALEKVLAHLVFDRKLVEKMHKYQVGFISKNQEHLAFFGGYLTGVHTVRMTETDMNMFYEDVLETDSDIVEIEIRKVTTINQEFKVSANPMNLVLVYLAHKFLTSDLLEDKAKERGALDAMLVLNYKILTSILSWFFKYPADPKIAEATYAALNYKFILKREGSWGKTLESRSSDIIDKGSIHHSRLIKFDVDEETVYMLNDIHGRIKDFMKNIYSVFIRVHESGDYIISTASTGKDAEGVEVIKEKTGGLENYKNYIKTIASDRDSFIKTELTSVIVRMMHTIQPKGFMKTLDFLSANYGSSKYAYIDELLDKTVVHAYHYVGNHSSTVNVKMELSLFLSTLRGGYMSSRSVDPDLVRMREIGFKLVKDATGTTNEGALASIRTGIFLYIALRSYTRDHYS